MTAIDELTAVELPLTAIEPWGNDRRDFDDVELRSLAVSMQTTGLAQPITVRPRYEVGRYWLVAGERRWRAAISLGWKTIPSFVRQMDDDQALNVMLVENIARADLNPIEEGEAYRRRLDTGVTLEELAEVLGVPPTRIEWKLDLLRLGEYARTLVESGALGWASAWHMVGLDEDRQRVALKAHAEKNLTMSDMELLCGALRADQEAAPLFDPGLFLQIEEIVVKAQRENLRLSAVQTTRLAARVLDAILPAVDVDTLDPEAQADLEHLQRVIEARKPKQRKRRKS